MSDFIPVNEPLLIGNEKKYLNECIDTNWISSEGPFVKRFEDEFATRMGRKHGIAVSNGTAAIDIAVEVLGIGEGDEVILPTFTIISCVLQIVRSGATPVLVDSDPLTWNMDITQIKAKITPRTKAIMVVHIYGLPVDMDPILDLCERYDLKMIEDAAEMIGQTYRGRPCGSFGDLSTFSFYPNKHITTGEGGMVLTDDEELAEKCRSMRNLCFQREQRFVHDKLGWNYRMTNLQAALGLAQLEQLERFVDKKRTIGKTYTKLLKGIKEIQLPLEKTDYAENIYWVYGIVLKDDIPFDAKEAMQKLGKQGIGTRPFFWPMHLQPVLLENNLFQGEKYPVAERISKRGFYIPSGLGLDDFKIEKVVIILQQILHE
ncbi:MAG: DegT/DnrJ/EryC1/StrS family aminotransferase [Candidatus Scalindua sp.]|jgi:perosamine synthetase|nr:DegT/DnrJ/EryC1/StrS family aminotransferase [Candidatus Scalindua sp.]